MQRPIKIGSRCVDEKKMVKALGDQPPAANQRVTQNQSRIIPDKTVAQSGRIANEDSCKKDENGPDFFHEREINKLSG